MAVPHYSKDDFDSVLKKHALLLIDFYAEWCGPCQMAAPIIDKLGEEYKDTIHIAKVNIDENQDLAQKYSVMSIPTMIVFKDGKEVDKKVGFPGEQGVRDLIKKNTGK